jgi:hypothetical protein
MLQTFLGYQGLCSTFKFTVTGTPLCVSPLIHKFQLHFALLILSSQSQISVESSFPRCATNRILFLDIPVNSASSFGILIHSDSSFLAAWTRVSMTPHYLSFGFHLFERHTRHHQQRLALPSSLRPAAFCFHPHPWTSRLENLGVETLNFLNLFNAFEML